MANRHMKSSKRGLVGRLEHNPLAVVVGPGAVIGSPDFRRIAIAVRLELLALGLAQDHHEAEQPSLA